MMAGDFMAGIEIVDEINKEVSFATYFICEHLTCFVVKGNPIVSRLRYPFLISHTTENLRGFGLL